MSITATPDSRHLALATLESVRVHHHMQETRCSCERLVLATAPGIHTGQMYAPPRTQAHA